MNLRRSIFLANLTLCLSLSLPVWAAMPQDAVDANDTLQMIVFPNTVKPSSHA